MSCEPDEVSAGQIFWKAGQTNQRKIVQQNESMSTDSVVEVEKEKWKVKSEDGKRSYNIIKQCESYRDASCVLQCQRCNICVHMFLCNCPDGLTQSTICKHVHLLQNVLQLQEKKRKPWYHWHSFDSWCWKKTICEGRGYRADKQYAKATRKKKMLAKLYSDCRDTFCNLALILRPVVTPQIPCFCLKNSFLLPKVSWTLQITRNLCVPCLWWTFQGTRRSSHSYVFFPQKRNESKLIM